jgi:two-component system phosphate regulon sensor histidine kinase PhoR
MVDELGELSLVETGQVVLECGPVDVRAVLDRTVARLEAQAARAGVDLKLEAPGDLPQPIGDVRRVEQVLVNLMHNAIKFTAPGGRITLGARLDGDRVVVSVADTGTGIAEEDLERIFERFYKTDKSRGSTGTGLGLAIARHIVEAHGGVLWADSVEGKGSTFYFSLPL